MTDRSRTFFQLQASARRRSMVLLGGSFVILWLAANMIAVAVNIGTRGCGPGEDCELEFLPRPGVAVVAAVVVAAYLLIAWQLSGRAALALAGARPADPVEHAQLHHVVEEMALASGTPMPAVYVIEDPSPNAFATGRDPRHAAITVTTGLLDRMSRRELTGVVAHEMAHIRNRDIAVTTLAVLTAGAIAVMADLSLRVAWAVMRTGGRRRDKGGAVFGIGLAALALGLALYAFALPAALLLRAALSRQREQLADHSAVQFTRDPTGIRSALEKLEADMTVPARVSAATAHMWIDEPRPASGVQRTLLNGLLDTHPPMARRIALLRAAEGLDPTLRGPNDPRPGGNPSAPASHGAWPPP